jgi:hypothetical protein
MSLRSRGPCEHTSIRDFRCVGLNVGDANGWEEANGIVEADRKEPIVSYSPQLADGTVQQNNAIVIFSDAFKLNSATQSTSCM